MRIVVTNRNSASEISPVSEGLGKTVIIRVTSYKFFKALEHCEEFHDKLQLRFPDIEDSEYTAQATQLLPIQEHHAKTIIAFLHKNKDANCLIVHCDAGYSRSPAIALAACDILELTEERAKLQDMVRRNLFAPNGTVYRRITEAAGLRGQKQAELEEVFSKLNDSPYI